MSVAEQADPRIYNLDEILSIFSTDGPDAKFGFSDELGFQKNFIEVQVWERSWLSYDAYDVCVIPSTPVRRLSFFLFIVVLAGLGCCAPPARGTWKSGMTIWDHMTGTCTDCL